VPVPEPEVLAEHGEPPAAPGPVSRRSDRLTAPTKTLNTTNAENFHRSANAPVGIVAAVSMKTIWNRKYAKTGAVYATPVRKNPVPRTGPTPYQRS